jgi:hypothetical protein
MATYTMHLWCYSDAKEDDPCDDWSGHPIPKPQKDDNK